MYDEPGWARVASAVVLRRSLAECRVGAEPYTRSAIVRRTKNSHRKLRAWIQIWIIFDHLCFDSIGEYSDFWWHEVAEKKLHKYGPTMELWVYRKKNNRQPDQRSTNRVNRHTGTLFHLLSCADRTSRFGQHRIQMPDTEMLTEPRAVGSNVCLSNTSHPLERYLHEHF